MKDQCISLVVSAITKDTAEQSAHEH